MRQRESSLGVAWGARRKPGPASPANMSKRGLSARHSVPNQTLSLVNFRLPKGNVAAGNQGRPGGYGAQARVPCPEGGVARLVASPFETAVWRLPQTQDGRIRRRVLAANSARGLLENFSPSRLEGAGKTGCLLHPRSRVRFCAKQKCTRAYRAAGAFRPSLRNGFTAYSVLSPVNGFLATVAGGTLPASLAPAPRRQDHTTSPYAQATHVSRSSRVHRISPRVRDDGQRPSSAVRRAELCG